MDLVRILLCRIKRHILKCVTEVHSAKTFSVHYRWIHPDKENVQPSTGFRVPDDDEIEAVSIASSSEDDVPIIESRPRKYSNTYSVPSSDDEGFQSSDEDDEAAARSVSPEVEEISAPTTPGSKTSATSPKKDSAMGERRELNLKGPSLQELLNKGPSEGSSQQNPIDLDDVPTKTRQIDDTESEGEDDGPEVFPTRRTSPPPRPQRPLPGLMTHSKVDTTSSTYHPHDDVVLETQAKPITASGGGNIDITFSSIDDGDFDDEDESDDEAYSPYSPVPTAPLISNAALPKPTPEENNPPPTASYAIQASELLDVSRGTAGKPPYQRTPSPSDAALAKKAPSNQIRKDLFNAQETNPMNTYNPYNYHSFDPISEEDFRPPHFYGTCGFGMISDNPYQAWRSTTQEWKNQKAASVSSTNQMPFGLVNQAEKPSQKIWEDSYNNDYENMINEAQQHFHSFHGGPHYEDLPKENTQEYQPSKPLDVAPPAQIEQEASQKSSRLNISNLINDNHTSQQRQPLKRKADEISSDNEEEQIKPLESDLLNRPSGLTKEAIATMATQQTQLPDAQARDVPSIASSPFESQVEAPEPAVNSPVVKSSEMPPTANFVENEEPPRKKIKTVSTSSKASGIAKFVSGVAVGVVGVIATIIATAPASVHEEALREVTMLL